MEPEVGVIYDGSVTSLLQFGAIVALDGLAARRKDGSRARWEGLVHISNMQNTRVAQVGGWEVPRHSLEAR